MLALTHHLIVQYSAQLAGFPKEIWFDRYEVLGDDIQIFDHRVASIYLAVMKSLGVEVNESKSVISLTGTTVEFAKRLSYHGVDVSPIS